jgi:histidyl-tRNA synthetase
LRRYAVPGVVLHVNSIGDDCCRPAYREALLAHFRPHAAVLSADSQRRLERNPLRILDSKAAEDRALVASAPTFGDTLCAPCAAHFAGVLAYLEAIGIPFVVAPRLVRGFDYYTRTVFEFISDALGAQSTVCGGGRYDDLVRSLGGPPTPAVGFGLGIERFLMVLDQLGHSSVPPRRGIAAIALGGEARATLVPLVAALRSAGDVPVTIDYHDGKLQTHFKKADRANARAALILGDDERAAGVVVARDLATREQERLGPAGSVAELAETILAWYRALAPASPVAA